MQRMVKLGIILAGGMIAYTIAQIISVGNTVPYTFIRANHPIDMERGNTGRWLYFSLDGNPVGYAKTARAELLAEGFTEDMTQKPWFHFVKGDREVIVCNCQQAWVEYQANRKGGVTIGHEKATPIKGYDPNKYTTVWVHEPGGSAFQVTCFKIKKTILLW